MFIVVLLYLRKIILINKIKNIGTIIMFIIILLLVILCLHFSSLLVLQ